MRAGRPASQCARPWLLLTLLLVAALTVSPPALAQKAWESHDAGNADLRNDGLWVRDSWHGGVLRLEIKGRPMLADDWIFDLVYPSGETLRVDAVLARHNAIGDPNADPLRIDVPLTSAGRLSVSGATDGVSVRAQTVSHPSRVNTQQSIDGSNVIWFASSGEDLDGSVGLGFGRLDVIGSEGPIISCTAFRVATQYWLTAGHCAAAAGVTHGRIQPLDYHLRETTSGFLDGRFVATGRPDGTWNPGEDLAHGDPDYALLFVEDDPGGPTFPLASAPVSENEPLLLLMNWPNDQSGKARAEGRPCRVRKLVGTADKTLWQQCFQAIQHGCTSDWGASGAALVSRADPIHFIGLHYGGWNDHYNCALPAERIRNHICTTQPSIGGAITTCPSN